MEYLCLTLLANAGESEAAFKSRLTAFWTHSVPPRGRILTTPCSPRRKTSTPYLAVCRVRPMVEADAADVVVAALAANSGDVLPLDRDDTYTKYEVSGSEWFQIPH